MGAFENAIREEETFESLMQLYKKALRNERKLRDCLIWFNKRVEDGEVRSIRTYNKFLEVLRTTDD